MTCPCCEHDMLVHDGDGYDEPYACAACPCAWEIGVDGRPETVRGDD